MLYIMRYATSSYRLQSPVIARITVCQSMILCLLYVYFIVTYCNVANKLNKF